MDKHTKDLFFETLQMLRGCTRDMFTDWKDNDDWLFSELNFTKSEIDEIYDGRGVLVYTGSCK